MSLARALESGALHAGLLTSLTPTRVALVALHRRRFGWSPARIRAWQDARVRDLVSYCWRYVPYYREKWSPAIRDPGDIRGVSDLAVLPLLTKDELRDHLPALTTTSRFLRSAPARSGGSTGRPTLFRMTPFDEALAWAQMYVAWSWAGWRIGDPFLVVGGQSIGVGLSDNRTWKDWIVNRWVTSGSNLTLERTKALAALPHFHRVRLIYGYPSAIHELCDLLRTIGARPRGLRGVVCTAEVMRPEVRAGIEQSLGVRVYDKGGLNDGGLFAAEGPARDGLHVFFMRGVLEILDAEDRVIAARNVPGRAIATCLTNRATPFVRYVTGDDVHWYDDTPSAGVAWQRIGPVDGRTGDVIHLPSGRRIAMPGLTLVMRWLEGLRQYQFIQTGPSSVTARLERGPGYTLSEDETTAYLSEKISDEIRWHIEWGPPQLTQNQKVLIIRNDWLRAQGGTPRSELVAGPAPAIRSN